MNYSDYRFTLDIQIHQAQVSIPVTLGDTARQLCIGLTDGRKPYYIADGCRAVFSAKKPDGTTIFNDCIIYNNTTIVYEFSKNTTSCEGIVDCEIRLYDAYGKELTSPQFIIVVDKKVMRDEEVAISVNEATTIANMISAEQGRVVAEAARVVAEKGRVSAENARVEAENARIEAENERIASEEVRVNKETERAVAENNRITAEEARVIAENLRAAAEEGRVEAIINAVKEGISKGLAMEIANDLVTNDPERALSAAQGVALKGLIDLIKTNNTLIDTGWYNGTNYADSGSTPCPIVFPFAPRVVFIRHYGVAYTAYYENPGYYWTSKFIVLFPDLNVGFWLYYNNAIGASGGSGNATISMINSVNKSEDGKTIDMPFTAQLYTSLTSKVLATDGSGYGNYYVALG